MNRRPLLFLLGLFSSIVSLRAADGAPSFVVQNTLLESATAITLPPPPPPASLSATLDGAVLSVRLGDGAPTVIDPHASAGCPPAFVTFADDSALLVWRGHAENNARDIRTARFIDGAWKTPSTLIADNWRTAAIPAGEGPVIDHRGPHVAVAWFTAAGGPSVYVALSGNAGDQWLMPNRVDDVAPLGRPSVVLLDDGAQLVSWVERLSDDYVILLRRVSSRGTLSVPVQLARLSADPGHPRLVRVKDGDTTPAQLLLTYTDKNLPVSRLITLPDAAALAEADACDCDPRSEDQRGFALQGRIVSADPKAGTITLAHVAIPGVMKAGTTVFKAAPDLIAAATSGKRVFARTERIGPDWWLFNLRLLNAP